MRQPRALRYSKIRVRISKGTVSWQSDEHPSSAIFEHGSEAKYTRARPSEFGYTASVKCVECNQRKGKRHCPALNRHICAQCCGENRVVKINCAPDCAFLTTGQAYHGSKKYTSLVLNEENPQKRLKLMRTMEQDAEIIVLLEQVIVAYSGSLTSLRDRDVLDSVQLLKGTYRTESRGIIYEESSSNPLAQALVNEMRDALERKRAEGGSEGLRLGATTAMNCLEVIEADILYYLKTDENSTEYLAFISRNHPEAASPNKQSGLIIAP